METLKKDLTSYPAYKDSAIPWLGQIPAHWDVVRNKTLFSRRREVVGDQHNQYTLLSLTLQGVIPRDMEQAKGKFPSDFSTYQAVKEGDFVFCLFDMDETPRTIGIAPLSGMITGAYTVFTPKSLEPRFIYYLYLSLDDRKALKPLYTGLRKVIPEDRFLQTKTPLPPPDEQAAIARYLDGVDRRIRRYIRAKQKLIKLLEEQKQAIIHQAVTRGLDPNVPLKDSGVEWLGQVPAHWEVTRLKFVADKIVDCLHATPNYTESGSFPAIRTADISPGVVRLESAKRVDTDEYNRWTQRLEPAEGDILYSREGGRFGIAACVPESVKLCISQRMMLFRIKHEHNSAFIMWLLNSPQVFAQATQDVMGAASPHVNVSTIQNYSFALPPINIQNQIVQHIRLATGRVDSILSRARREIDLIREYRTRLIADVVTGQVDVRGAAASWAVDDVVVEESVLDEGWADDEAEEALDDAVLEGEE